MVGVSPCISRGDLNLTLWRLICGFQLIRVCLFVCASISSDKKIWDGEWGGVSPCQMRGDTPLIPHILNAYGVSFSEPLPPPHELPDVSGEWDRI